MQEIRNIVPIRGTVFGSPECSNLDELSADIAFLGFPYEQGCMTALPSGKKWGAKGIRHDEKGYKYQGGSGGKDEEACGWFDIDTGTWQLRGVTMADCGDVNILPAEGERNMDSMTNCDRLTEVVKKILDRSAFPVVMGGDHTQPYPILKAYGDFTKFHPIDIVHFDSHHDFWDSIGGAKINDADCITRCSELPFVDHITSIGINSRSRMGQKDYDAAIAYGVNIITPDRFKRIGVTEVIESIPKANNIYVTVDIDCMNCFEVPGISGRECGALSYLDVEQTLKGIPMRGNVIGFDITGLIPDRDFNGITARVCNNLIAEALAAIFPSKR